MIYSCCNENRKSALRLGAITATPTVDAPGAGYVAGDVLTIAQGASNKTAQVRVIAVSGGKVTQVALQQNGTGYLTASGVPTTGGTGTGCTLNISSNGIDYLEVLDHDAISLTPTPAVAAPGSGYTIGDTLTILQTGSGPTAQVNVAAVSGSGGVTAVSLGKGAVIFASASGVPTAGGSGTGCTLNIIASSPRQRTLLVHCLWPVPSTITTNNVLITGGESIINVGVDWVAPAAAPPADPVTNASERAYFTSLPDAANVLLVRTSKAGDFSPYLLRLVDDVSRAEASSFAVTDVLPGFDPQLTEVQFSFKVECGPNFDCAPPAGVCPPRGQSPPSINYLAKDYGSFRGIMLDRLSQLLPGWGANSEADLGIALVELIAYVADRFSYQQDAIATEAYLETARSRISLRRHALLVDYHVHDGCNARTWMHLTVTGNPGDKVFLDRKITHFYTYAPGMPTSLSTLENQEAALRSGAQIFQPMWDQFLYPEHNQLSFHAWGETNCCLPQGATEATLRGSLPKLAIGDLLIFQEMVGPRTGNAADADIRHRCAVRLTKVATQDASGNPLVDPLFDDGTGLTGQSPNQKLTPTPVTEIQWAQEDALPFPVCISSSYLDDSGATQVLPEVSVAFGNIVLADHGLSVSGVDLGSVPPPSISLPPDPAADHCSTKDPASLPVRFRPPVPDSPITHAVPFTEISLSEVGNPKTAGVVPLLNAGLVSLPDTDGFPALSLQATNPNGWPSSFGVQVAVNAGNSANFDLSVVYDSGVGGLKKLLVVEKFANLSFNPADANYVVQQINGVSMLIRVPASYTPPAALPTGFPTPPTMLSNSAQATLLDLVSKPYLTLQVTDASSWPALFGVQAQPSSNPVFFDLTVVYSPSSPLGVTLPVTLESFTNLSLQSTATQVNGKSALITVTSFASTAASELSAFSLVNVDGSQAVPVITLSGISLATTETWEPKQDLLENGESDRVFVVELESDGTAILRFGDDTNGRAPETGIHFIANYRIGNGAAGNVGADTLVFTDALNIKCSNPLPGIGGADPETNDQIRRRAPQAFLTPLERAVTMADYAHFAEQTPQVDKAVATLRWTGSWYTVFLTVEPQGAGNVAPALKSAVETKVDRYHLAGQDLEVEDPQYVPLELQLEVCVDPDYFQTEVQGALKQVLGSGVSPTGQKGFFYPDNFTFGQTVYLSKIYTAARSVAGVRAVRATSFQPQGTNATDQYLQSGEIPIGQLQVARLANDPSFPNHGQLSLVMEGGK